MLKSLRVAILLFAAVLFGTAQAACACSTIEAAAVAQSTAASAHEDRSANAGGQHAPVTELGEDHDATKAPCCEEAGHCNFHTLSALAGDMLGQSVLAEPLKITAFTAILPAAPVATPPAKADADEPERHWLPPPQSSPVSMKIRLRR